jgi:hypothetical protein
MKALIQLHTTKSLNSKNNYIAGLTIYLSVLTLNVNGFNSPSKDTVWQTGLKRKIQQSVVYKRLILSTETNTDLR